MHIHLHREIGTLKKKISIMGGKVEDSLQKSIRALTTNDVALAEKVIAADREIDHFEIEIEEECLKILALHQPVAVDLRFVVAILKINNDLERIADLATNIAERAIDIRRCHPIHIPKELEEMATKVQAMLKDCIDALINLNELLAQDILTRDKEIDELHKQMYGFVEEGIRKDTERIGCYINLLSISRQLERIGDQVTNIAEDVVYLESGQIIRHNISGA